VIAKEKMLAKKMVTASMKRRAAIAATILTSKRNNFKEVRRHRFFCGV